MLRLWYVAVGAPFFSASLAGEDSAQTSSSSASIGGLYVECGIFGVELSVFWFVFFVFVCWLSGVGTTSISSASLRRKLTS